MNILLVHGLGRTPLSMFGLAPALRRAGHKTSFFAYTPTLETLPRILTRLAGKLRSVGRSGEPIGLVGHSLGGLLLRMVLPEAPGLRVHHLVMLGTPNQGPGLARLASRWRVFRALTRDCGRLLADAGRIAALPVPPVGYTLVAGTAGPRGAWSPFGGNANDGVVAAAEVPVRAGDPVALFPVWHTWMMNAGAVREAVVTAMMSPPDLLPHS